MKATYDSDTGKLTCQGSHHGTPKIWTVSVRASTEEADIKLTVRPKMKVRICELSDIIERELRAEGAVGRIRWTAIAR